MKVVGLISGGKDGIYNIMQCVAHGHEVRIHTVLIGSKLAPRAKVRACVQWLEART